MSVGLFLIKTCIIHGYVLHKNAISLPEKINILKHDIFKLRFAILSREFNALPLFSSNNLYLKILSNEG